MGKGGSSDEVGAALASRLRARFSELETGLATLIEDPTPGEAVDPGYLDYLDSLRDNRPAVLEYAAEVIEFGEQRAPDVPPAVLVAARLAARCGVPLDTILGRYSAGNALCRGILLEEAARADVPSSDLRRLLRRQAVLFDRLLEAVSEEHAREAGNQPTTAAERRHRYIKDLLAGRQPDGAVELGYNLDGHHLALMTRGKGADEAIRELAQRLDRQLLADRSGEELWACWLGGDRPLAAKEAQLLLLTETPEDRIVIALGEPGEGIAGWRLSHSQAKAALPLAEHSGQSLAYADVAVIASILRDNVGTTSLRRLYLEPLERTRDGGEAWRETLRAYFASDRNVSTTATALGVDRRTVTNRLHAIENLFDRPLDELANDLETALQLAG